MPNVHLTDEQLTEFRDGVLWNPVVVSHLRSCPICQTRLREIRLLRILLARPEQKRSDHPAAEDLAAYLEGQPGGMNLTKLEAHVAGCPQCFADLTAIREQLQPVSTPEEAPPEWVVARAARAFQPPETRLNLGILLVHWLNRLGPFLRLIPPPEPNLAQGPASALGSSGVAFLAFPSVLFKMSARAYRIERSFEPAESHRVEESEEAREESSKAVEPVDVTIGHFKVRITPQGRTRDQVTLTIVVTRSVDNAPAPGVQLSLEADQRTLATTTTGDNGVAEFPLPQGQATLVFQSPVRAELQISF